MKIAKKLIKKSKQDGINLWKAILDWRNTPTKEMSRSQTKRLMSRRKNTQSATVDAIQKPHVETNLKKMLTMKH